MQTATLHVLPTCPESRVFEVRRLAVTYGCAFATTKRKATTSTKPAPLDPNDGGRAA
ncbi:hypothetical protein SAMN04490193_5134 [Pseudomonas marginalis]|nr:hypothetical protein SAMN04490193_5134 [Pseudomonas marginalis]